VKIVYVVEDLGIAGGVKVIVEHAEGLAARGHDVSIVTKGPPPEWIRVGVPIVQVTEFSAATLPRADVHVATWYTTVVPTVEAHRAERVFHFSQGYEAIYPHVAAHKEEIDRAYAQKIPKLLISEHLVGLFEGKFPGSFHVVPQAIRAADYAPHDPKRARARRPPAVGVVGPFEGLNKGIRVALSALSRLRAEGRRFFLHRASQTALSADELSYGPCDLYVKGASVERMADWYRGLDLLVHPSFEAEGFPLPPLEAMAAGVPVVLTAIPSFDPIPRDAASWVPPGDDAAMALEAARLLDDEALWASRRARGFEVAAAFSLENALDALEKAFQKTS